MLERVLVIGLRLRGVVLAVCAVEAGSDVVVAIGGMMGVVAVGKGKNVDGVRVAGGAGSAMVDLKKKRKNENGKWRGCAAGRRREGPLQEESFEELIR